MRAAAPWRLALLAATLLSGPAWGQAILLPPAPPATQTVNGTIADSNSAPYTVFTAIPTVSASSSSPTAMPSGYRALAFTCTGSTVVFLIDAAGDPAIQATVGTSPGFHSFFSELPASFYVPGTNSCVFTAEK